MQKNIMQKNNTIIMENKSKLFVLLYCAIKFSVNTKKMKEVYYKFIYSRYWSQ